MWNLRKMAFSSVQSLSHVRLFVTPWIAALQASLSITNSQSSLRLASIWAVMLPPWNLEATLKFTDGLYLSSSLFQNITVLLATGIFSSFQSLSHVRLFVTPWITARQASLSITNSWSSPKLMSIESVMPSSHLIFCRPLLLLPPIPPSIRIFSNESTLRMRWPKYWSFSLSIGLLMFKTPTA